MKILKTVLFYCLLAWMMQSCDGQKSQNESAESTAEQEDLVKVAKEALDFALVQYAHATTDHSDSLTFPRSLDEEGKLIAVKPRDWTSGFFAGVLWYLYDYSGDEKWLQKARKWTESLEEVSTYGGTHDLGFMIFCSYGNGYRLTGNENYKETILTASRTLSGRYNPTVGCIRSWDFGDWKFPVIIDNMMNLEMLFWSTEVSGDSSFYNLSIDHANTTMEHHYRPNHSCFHVVDYDPETGEVLWKGTHQGYADESTWARGQAWGLYGYVMSYRETGDEKYLQHAEDIADFILANLPEDKIPYWDYNAPGQPDIPRDASAAAITCSALLELSQIDGVAKSEEYLQAAEGMIRSLASPEYTAAENQNGNFILLHSTGNKPKDSEVDVPLIYADYYYVEALLRYLQMQNAL